MSAGFRAKTKLCPVLDTDYIQHPRTDTSIRKYIPGKGWALCVCNPPRTTETVGHRVLMPPPTFLPLNTIEATFIIQGPMSSITITNTYLYNQDIVDIWDTIRLTVFELYGNCPVRYGTLQGLVNIHTNISYPYGTPLPNTGGRFRPTVSFN